MYIHVYVYVYVHGRKGSDMYEISEATFRHEFHSLNSSLWVHTALVGAEYNVHVHVCTCHSIPPNIQVLHDYTYTCTCIHVHVHYNTIEYLCVEIRTCLSH